MTARITVGFTTTALLCSCARTRSASLGDSPNLRRELFVEFIEQSRGGHQQKRLQEGEIEKGTGQSTKHER